MEKGEKVWYPRKVDKFGKTDSGSKCRVRKIWDMSAAFEVVMWSMPY